MRSFFLGISHDDYELGQNVCNVIKILKVSPLHKIAHALKVNCINLAQFNSRILTKKTRKKIIKRICAHFECNVHTFSFGCLIKSIGRYMITFIILRVKDFFT